MQFVEQVLEDPTGNSLEIDDDDMSGEHVVVHGPDLASYPDGIFVSMHAGDPGENVLQLDVMSAGADLLQIVVIDLKTGATKEMM